MRRGTQFITAALTAALTFGILTLTLGERHHERWGGHHDRWHHHDAHEKEHHQEEKVAPDKKL
jgi:hypothetical protein